MPEVFVDTSGWANFFVRSQPHHARAVALMPRVAGQIEGLPYRFGAHPSAYTASFCGRGHCAGCRATG